MEQIEKGFMKFKEKVSSNNIVKCREISSWILKQINFDKNSNNNHITKMKDSRKMHPVRPKRGEIFMADMGCNVGFEFKDYHPVLILQNDRGNIYSDTTVVLPITGKNEKVKVIYNIHQEITNENFESIINHGLDKEPSIIKLSDIITIDKSRLNTKIGKLSPEIMKMVNIKIKKLLDLY